MATGERERRYKGQAPALPSFKRAKRTGEVWQAIIKLEAAGRHRRRLSPGMTSINELKQRKQYGC
jgi:hypothetical protein